MRGDQRLENAPVKAEAALRIHQMIAREIGSEILAGCHKPGELLEGEVESAERLGISRTAYREAMRILVAKGLIESRPRAGTRVTSRDNWSLLDPELLAWAFSSEPDPVFVRDLFELRAVIEPAAAAFAAHRRSTAQLGDLQSALEAMAHHGLSVEAGRAADQSFHRTILLAANNTALATLASSIGAAVSWTTTFKQRKRLTPRDPLPDHQVVYEAIASGDSDSAQRAMAELVRLALDDMNLPSASLFSSQ